VAARPGRLDLDDSTRRISRAALRVLAHGGPADPDDLVLLRAVGACRAGQGMPLDSVLAGLRLAVWAGWNDILAHIRRLPLADANISVLGTLAMRLFGFSDEAAAALAAGHAENRDRSRRREQERGELFEQLLAGDFSSEDEMVRRAAGFGYDLTSPHGLLLLTGRDRAAVRAAAMALRKALPGAVVQAQRAGGAATGVEAMVVVVPAVDPAAWPLALECARRAAAERGVTAVVAPPVARPGRIAQAYGEAAESVRLAAAVFARARVVTADELLAYRAVRGGAEERRRFVAQALGRVLCLPARQGEPLMETLEALFEQGGNVEATRRALGVHDKTIRYRIRRVRELTGLCPFRDRGRLELALMLHRLAGVGD
jgi:sugar diacid utilization regulator